MGVLGSSGSGGAGDLGLGLEVSCLRCDWRFEFWDVAEPLKFPIRTVELLSGVKNSLITVLNPCTNESTVGG